MAYNNASRGDGKASGQAEASWLRPRIDDADFRRYLSFVRLHRWLILICILIGGGAAFAYVKTATPVYTAESDLFITPVNSNNTATVALGLITSSGDPTGDIETAARLVTTINAADAVKAALRLRDSPQQILQKVSAVPVAQSDIVALSAQSHSANAAANLANSFASAVIAQRTAQFHGLVNSEIASLDGQLAGVRAASAEAGALRAQVAQLKAFLTEPLPDMRVSTLATPPSSPSSPRTTITVIGGLIGGAAVGLALAFMLELIDVRVNRLEQLHRLFRLPVLALIPREGRARRPIGRLIARLPLVGIAMERRRIHRSVPRIPEVLSPAALEAYRTLRATLLTSNTQVGDGPRSILVTSASAGEGKTTTAINLAFSLATLGKKVILIDADLHRASIARALELEPSHDISSVLSGEVSISEALVDSPSLGPNLRYLLARADQEPTVLVADVLMLGTAGFLAEAMGLSDFVVVDTPPLTELIDAIELARLVDDVLIVVRLNQTRVSRLVDLGELLARIHIVPAGIALVGVEPSDSRGYAYGYASYSPRTPVATPHNDLT